jgi:hypothetical protein
VTVNKL